MPGHVEGARRFDPRFDPQFQPGYRSGGTAENDSVSRPPSPGVELRPSRSTNDASTAAYARPSQSGPSAGGAPYPAAAPSSAAASFDGRLIDVDGRLLDGPGPDGRGSDGRGPDGRGPSGRGPDGRVSDASLLDGEVIERDGFAGDTGVETPSSDRRRNPFVVALWLVGAGLVVVGVGALGALRSSAAAADLMSTQSPWDYFFIQAITAAVPTMILLGIAVMVGLLFFHAVMRERTDRERRGQGQSSS